ncbi:XRE family transcriptional regulator [Rhizobium leguminosarum]|uniref:XRE family transcriptional regulator n=1 Tax=Rhizobium leguminosarum TaxID=384 RepID=UPI0016201311
MASYAMKSASEPPPAEALQVVRADLRTVLARVVADKGLSQTRAAKLCSTDQPTLSKILSGRSDSVSTDQLLRWLVQLGCDIDLTIRNSHKGSPGSIRASFDE